MAEQSDGRKQKADASCHAPTCIKKGRRSNFGSSASALLHSKITAPPPPRAHRSPERSEVRRVRFKRFGPKYIRVSSKGSNPRSYIAEIWSGPHRGISGSTKRGGRKRIIITNEKVASSFFDRLIFFTERENKNENPKSIKATSISLYP